MGLINELKNTLCVYGFYLMKILLTISSEGDRLLYHKHHNAIFKCTVLKAATGELKESANL